MKVAIVFPAHVSVIEKTAALFGSLDVINVDPQDETVAGDLAIKQERLICEGPELGFETRWINLEDANLDEYDVLIDFWEARRTAPSWREKSLTISVPRIVKISWFKPYTLGPLSHGEMEMLNRSVIACDSWVAATAWERATGLDVRHLFWYPGDWWFDAEWTGEDERLLYILAGAYKWRGGMKENKQGDRFWLWHEVAEQVPGYHLDGGEQYRTSLQLADEVRHFRCHTNLDTHMSSRHLCLAFTETLAAGVPQLIINRPEHDYHDFVYDGVSGFVCESVDELVTMAKLLLDDHDMAKEMSEQTKEIARRDFSRDVLLPVWLQTIEDAQRRARA